MTYRLYIEGMSCEHCSQNIHRMLSKVNGVKSVTVDLENNTAEVSAEADFTSEQFSEIIEDIGFELKSMEIVNE